MKALSTLFVAAGLVFAAPLAQACGMKPCGAYGGIHFKEMDKNGDGAVSKKEFEVFHNARFKELDVNKDGKLAQDEMGGGVGGGMGPKGPMMGGGLMFEQRFKEVDVNGDGMLGKDEAEIGMPIAFAHFDEYDTSKDGKLSMDEMTAGMKQMHQNLRDKCDTGKMKSDGK